MKHITGNNSDHQHGIKFISRNECRLFLEPGNAYLSEIEKLLCLLKEYLPINDDTFTNILISVTEAITNSIAHGNRFRPGTYVRVFVRYSSKSITFSIEDEGDGFDPDKIADPTSEERLSEPEGRGVYLMKAFTDSVQFSKNGKMVKLLFYLN